MIIEDAYEEVVEQENYFVSMTDMMVGLIFIFIIMLMYYALQFRDVTEQLAGADVTRAEILRKLEHTLKDNGIPVTIDATNGVLRLPDAILFDSAHYELKDQGRTAIRHLSDALSSILPCYSDNIRLSPPPRGCPATSHRIESVYIEGHTDIDPLKGAGQMKDNWDLSVFRATSTYREIASDHPDLTTLCAKKGGRCDPILSVSGYGPERPVDSATGDDAKRRNRRIDLRLIMITPDSGETARAVANKLGAH